MDENTEIEFEVNRKRLKSEYGRLYDVVSEILFRNDPIGINFETNTDEYEPEVDTILPRLEACHSVEDVQTMIHEEFVKWFDSNTAGSAERYREVAEEIWLSWQTSREQEQ
jgi:hypothetical protein